MAENCIRCDQPVTEDHTHNMAFRANGRLNWMHRECWDEAIEETQPSGTPRAASSTILPQ